MVLVDTSVWVAHLREGTVGNNCDCGAEDSEIFANEDDPLEQGLKHMILR
jgi:hypothetical protein